MSKDFVGRGYAEPTRYKVYVEQDGMRSDMRHQVHGLAEDYQWDGGGPQSADLASALLWLAGGVEPEFRIYRLFRSEIVAEWPRHTGECWRISEDEILRWLAGVEQDTVHAENTAQTKSRLDQTNGRESRLKRFTETLAGRRH